MNININDKIKNIEHYLVCLNICIIIFFIGLLIQLYVKPNISTFQYQGHDMIKVQTITGISICHSPECKKCTQFYD